MFIKHILLKPTGMIPYITVVDQSGVGNTDESVAMVKEDTLGNIQRSQDRQCRKHAKQWGHPGITMASGS